MAVSGAAGVPGRTELLADSSLGGAAWCAAYAAAVDRWLAELFADAGAPPGMALVAIGGYGRGELAPGSDIDVALVHRGGRSAGSAASVAERVWYPIWDAGVKLGHSVTTAKEALGLARSDLDTATALLSVRHIAGDGSVTAELAGAAAEQWRSHPKRWLSALLERVESRNGQAGEVAFLLEPDLKEGRGGLRDVHSLRWAGAVGWIRLPLPEACLEAAYERLLEVRVALQRQNGGSSNHLTVQEQDAVAARLGLLDADALMASVSAAGRTIAWASDEAWAAVRSKLEGPGRRAGRPRPVAAGVVLQDGEIHVDAAADPAADPGLALRAAAAAAERGTVIDHDSLDRLADLAPVIADDWTAESRADLVALLQAGGPAVRVIEALDQRRVWERVLPEWSAVRTRPQRNAYHRFTVDRHLVEAATTAAALADRVPRPDLLLIGALLHDIGKGTGADHVASGMVVAERAARRMGFPDDDVDTLVFLVERHLLLSEVALRRDLDDPDTIAAVAEAVGSPARLALLAALTEADSVATGPAAWSSWKAALVGELVERVMDRLEGDPLRPFALPIERFPDGELLALMSKGEDVVRAAGDALTVVAADRPGLFSTVTGVLALHGLAVRSARAYSDDDGRALACFAVDRPAHGEDRWQRVRADLERALDGRLALTARLADRSRAQLRHRRAIAGAGPSVRFDNEASSEATVIDVEAADRDGLLFRITRAMAELGLDIRSARVQTLGHHVVDAFYVVDTAGRKVTDPSHQAEIERAVLHAIREVSA